MSYRIGKADIDQLDLITNIGTRINVSRIVHRIMFYEDLYSAHLTCNISLVDGASVRSTFPLVGGEVVDMYIGERGDKERDLTGKFIVYKMGGRERSEMDVEYYTLNLTTPEYMRDGSIIVQTPYVQKRLSDIVRNVVENYFTPMNGKTLIEVEETNGLHTIIPTGISPTAVIRQCVREAQSIENPSSVYLFYETVEGYHFVTIEKLYSAKAKHSFVYDEQRHSEASLTNTDALQYNIRQLNYENNFDLFSRQLSGGYSNINQSFDPLAKSFSTQVYTGNNNTVPSMVANNYFSNPTYKRLIVTNSKAGQLQYVIDRDPSLQNTHRRREQFMGNESVAMHQFSSIRLNISVPGNSRVKVGDTCNIIIPRASTTQDERMLNDAQFSGKYLISAVSHKIDAQTSEFSTVMELLRPEFEEGIENV